MQQRQNIKTKISNLESEKNPKLPFFERLPVMPVGLLLIQKAYLLFMTMY